MCRVFFAIVVLISGFGFLLSSCGTGPLTKTLVEKGAYAVFFPNTNTEYISVGRPGETLNGSEFTIEAWIKTDNGNTIFARGIDSTDIKTDGFALSISGNNASFDLWKESTNTPYSVAGTDADGDISDGQWHHVAGVLVDEGHTYHSETATCTVTAMASTHIEIYIDGVYRDCSDADILTMLDNSLSPDSLGADIGGVLGLGVFIGTIDEVRLWREARTAGQIETWRHKEITVENWNQADALIGYWKLNQGTGSTAIDSSGYGHGGAKLLGTGKTDPETGLPIFGPWDGGWVAGYPF